MCFKKLKQKKKICKRKRDERGQRWEMQVEAGKGTHLLPFREPVRQHVTATETDISQGTSPQLLEPEPACSQSYDNGSIG